MLALPKLLAAPSISSILMQDKGFFGGQRTCLKWPEQTEYATGTQSEAYNKMDTQDTFGDEVHGFSSMLKSTEWRWGWQSWQRSLEPVFCQWQDAEHYYSCHLHHTEDYCILRPIHYDHLSRYIWENEADCSSFSKLLINNGCYIWWFNYNDMTVSLFYSLNDVKLLLYWRATKPIYPDRKLRKRNKNIYAKYASKE